MANKKLWLKNSDIPELTSFSGNIDAASLLPHIYTAQRTEMKRVLGVDLYKCIDDKIQNNIALVGEYKKIFDEYIVDMLVYFSAMNYMAFGGYKTANAGVFKTGGDGNVSVDYKEVAVLIDKYRSLGVSVENDFQAYIKTVNLMEYDAPSDDTGSLLRTWF